jgi:hypothetical protein
MQRSRDLAQPAAQENGFAAPEFPDKLSLSCLHHPVLRAQVILAEFSARDDWVLGVLARAQKWKIMSPASVDIGCEYGGGVTCASGKNKESFFGIMLYDRTWWFHSDLYAATVGGGFTNIPGRYLALTPPINEATPATGSPHFTQTHGQKLFQWDTQLNF